MAHISQIVADKGISVILTTHYPNHALLYATRVLALDRDKSYIVGAPSKVITERYLRDTYSVETEIHEIELRNGQHARMYIPNPSGKIVLPAAPRPDRRDVSCEAYEEGELAFK